MWAKNAGEAFHCTFFPHRPALTESHRLIRSVNEALLQRCPFGIGGSTWNL
jgi:hypothetical protein